MKIGKLHTLWIVILSSIITGIASIKAIGMSLMGKADRISVDRLIQQWINNLLDRVGVQCKVINPHQVKPEPGKATIIMCNHTSIYDIPISYKLYPELSMRMLAKKELSRIPFLGRAMRKAEFPFIDRKNRYQAIKDLAYARQLMESGIILWISPEGTRSKDGKLAPFKKGAFITAIQSKASIIPIGIRGAYDILPAKTYRYNINRRAEIHVGTPIDTTQYTLENKEELVAKVHQAILELSAQELR